jgi:hypothetical protein
MTHKQRGVAKKGRIVSSQASINAYIAGAGKPASVTLADDIHIFHFEADGNWREAALLFVNRNGHHFRVIRQADGNFLFCKTWNGMFDSLAWMTEANLRRPNAEALIKLCGSGPQGRNAAFEGLCLLPRPATTGRRKAAWRGHLIDVGFDRADDSFTLYHPYDRSLVQKFTGKPWESREAAAWCAQELAGFQMPGDQPAATAAAPAPVEDEQAIEAALAGVWGMF